MGERILKFILPTIPLILLGACVMAAFAAQDWDVQRTLFADDPMKKMEQILSPGAISNRETIEIVNIDLSDGGDEIALDLMFHSPLNVPVTVTEISADIAIGDGVGTLRLVEKVNVPAGGSAMVNMRGPFNGTPSMAGGQSISNLTMELLIGGITIGIEDAL
ncbi:MAG: hypothetical protein J7J06_01890 [Methanosarcinales archaeon]|nr:hypothetical protein [Methanosarcinales archaeon]